MAYSTPDTQIAGYVVTATDWNELVNNFLAVNSFFRQELWPDKESHPPLSGVTAAGISVAESSGAGTNKAIIPIVSFIGTADEARIWICRWPRGYGVSAILKGKYYMTGANTDDEAVMEAQVAALSDTDTSVTAKVLDTLNQTVVTVPDAIATMDEFSITLTNNDSVVAGDWVCIYLMRNGDDVSDTANVGDFALTDLVVDFDLAT